MTKFFNTTGPCRAEKHYMIDPLMRLGDIRKLIESEAYFVVHAPRQSGKTTTLDALAKRLTLEGKYTALRFSCETGRAYGSNINMVEETILEAIKSASANNLPPRSSVPRLYESSNCESC